MEYDNTNSGYLVKRGDKKKETDRDFSGVLNVNGEEFYLSGWRGQTRDGKGMIKIRIKPKAADNTWSGSARNRTVKAETADVF